jgi:porphobilinogen synthase
MVRETTLSVDNLIAPLFLRPGKNIRNPISSLPGQFHLSVDEAVKEAEEIARLGIPSVLLFGLPEKKDAVGSESWHPDSVVPRAIRAIKKAVPDLCVIADACFCEYTTHGHCGVILGGSSSSGAAPGKGPQAGGRTSQAPRVDHPHKPNDVDNDATLENLGRLAETYAAAGVDVIAPSGMMDGMIGFLRESLDEAEHEDVALMSYSAKYASAYYGPFREAVDSTPAFGDRRTYQMDPANIRDAIREVSLDVEEGADIVMVKPALSYLDVVGEIRREFDCPIAAYNVSGEYAMVKAAAQNGWIDEKAVVLETLVSMRRAGADLLITYHAQDAARWL